MSSYDGFDTTIDKKDLVAKLEERLKDLRTELSDSRSAQAIEMVRHRSLIVKSLRKAADDIESGELRPKDGRWCHVRERIEREAGAVPERTAELSSEVGRYEAVIFQVKRDRQGPTMRVTTEQITRWLSGKKKLGSRR